MRLLFESIVDKPYLKVKDGFDLKLFRALKPPLVKMFVARFDGCSPGNEVHIELNTLGKKQKWISVITREMQDEKEWSFVDEGKTMPWPLAKWKHHHRVVSLDDNSSKIIDDITYQCVHSWMDMFMYPFLWLTFAIRPSRYKKYFRGF